MYLEVEFVYGDRGDDVDIELAGHMVTVVVERLVQLQMYTIATTEALAHNF